MGFSEILTYPFGEGQPFGRKKPDIITQDVKDPKKGAVSTQLSRFLQNQIGTGVPRFTERDRGDKILSDFPEEGLNRATEFLSLDSDAFFDKFVKTPTIETFEEELLPLLREGFAGQLAGSGRIDAETEAARGLSRDLAFSRGEFGLRLPEAQFNIARAIKQENDKEAILQYQDWLKSLPIFNPVLSQSIQFLNESTNTGKTVLSFLDEGTEGVFGDVLNAIATIAGFAIAA